MTENPHDVALRAELEAVQAKLEETQIQLAALQAALQRSQLQVVPVSSSVSELVPVSAPESAPSTPEFSPQLSSAAPGRGARGHRWVLGGLLLAALVAGVGFLDMRAYFTYNANAARTIGLGVPVKVAPAQMEELAAVIGASSLTEPMFTVDVTSPLRGRIKEVYVDVGQQVAQGQTLAALDPAVYSAAVQTAEDALAKAKKELENSQAYWQRIQNLFAPHASQSSLEKVPLGEALMRAKTELENSQLHWQRISNLVVQRVIAPVELEEATLKLDAAKFNYAKAQEDIRLAREAASLRLETAKFDYTKAQEAVLVARRDIQNTVIVAPTDGVIMKRLTHPGENVKAEDKLFALGDRRSIMVVVRVPEEQVSRVSLGQRADITFDAFPGIIWTGAVAKIDPQTDPKTRTFKTYVTAEDPASKLTLGLAAYTRLHYTRHGLVIPKLAVVKNANEATVFVVENARAHLRPIKTGIELLHKVEVLSGLQEGQQVISYGLLNLRDGDQVNLQTLAHDNQ